MYAGVALTLVLLVASVRGQENETETSQDNEKVIELCSVCTCSEIVSVESDSGLILNILCSELDTIMTMPDLDKIVWPENKHGLKVAAAFEGLGLSTLGKLPPNSLVEVLQFNNNLIKLYWPNPFSELPNLKRLSFARNELQGITSDLFTNINDLSELDLSYNKLQDLQDKHFEPLKKLRRLNLQGNLFKIIPIDAILIMESLEDLDMSKNGILDVLLKRSDGEVIKNIKRLYLNDNRIRVLTKESFPDLNSFELLDLSNNVIESIDEDSFITCTSLTELNLGQNNISFNFILPSSLKIAILKQNTIHRWPIFPTDITYIDLSYNKLTEMFDGSAKFDNLEILNVAGNQIKELKIPNKLSNLHSLDISYNLLEDIPSSLNEQTFPNLYDLRLDGNPIHVIYFKNTLSVRTISMGSLSYLKSVGEKAFSNVRGRPVDNKNEKNCFSLFLTNCKSLTEIKDGAFEGTQLCSLDLSNNNMTTISRSLLDWTQITDGVNLQWNPWDCGCHLQWVLEKLLPLMYREYPHLLADFRCESPRAVQGLRMVHWYNWTEQAMCSDVYMRSGPHDSYLLEPSTASPGITFLGGISYLTLILSIVTVCGLIIVIILVAYLVKSRKRYRVRQAAMNRRRQNLSSTQNMSEMQKEQFKALNRA